jgi:hypothetical protein
VKTLQAGEDLTCSDDRSLKVAVQGPVLWPTPYTYTHTYIHTTCSDLLSMQISDSVVSACSSESCVYVVNTSIHQSKSLHSHTPLNRDNNYYYYRYGHLHNVISIDVVVCYLTTFSMSNRCMLLLVD